MSLPLASTTALPTLKITFLEQMFALLAVASILIGSSPVMVAVIFSRRFLFAASEPYFKLEDSKALAAVRSHRC